MVGRCNSFAITRSVIRHKKRVIYAHPHLNQILRGLKIIKSRHTGVVGAQFSSINLNKLEFWYSPE